MIHLILGDDAYQTDEAIRNIIHTVNQAHGAGEVEAPAALPMEGKAMTESGNPPKVGGRGNTRRREPEGTRAPVITRHDAADFGIAACIEAVQNISMWGSHTLVIVRRVDDWAWGQAEALITYAKSPNPAATLVLQAGSLDGRLKTVKELKPLCKVTDCKPLYANQIPDWIRHAAKKQDKQISLEAANWCLELVGSDLSMLKRALEGLSLYVGGKPTIDLADVEGFLSNTSQHDIFELCKALGQGRNADAVRLLANLLENGEPPVRMMVMIARHWRILLGLRTASSKAESDAVIRQFKLPPFFAGEYEAQAKRWEPRRLMRGLGILARTDRRLKSSKLDDPLIAELAMLQL